MTRRVVLDNIAHQDLHVALRHGPEFGDAVNQMILLPTEFEEAQRDFPILFRRDAGQLHAVALLGLDRDENLFLDGGRWTSRHVPLLQQRGPFSIGMAGPGAGEPMIHVDEEDARVGAADGFPVFLPHGGNGPYLDHVTRVLGLIHIGAQNAPAMYAAFDALGLLQPLPLEIMLDEETRYEIGGYLRIDPERLAALDGAQLTGLNRAGFLGAAFLISGSLANVSRLIERKNARRAQA